MRELLAEALSTENEVVGVELIDWVPQRYIDGTITEYPFSMEIETFGWAKRKDRLTAAKVRELKAKILSLPEFPKREDFPPEAPLIWVRFQDGDGCHV